MRILLLGLLCLLAGSGEPVRGGAREAALPFGQESIVEAEVPAAPADQHGIVGQ